MTAVHKTAEVGFGAGTNDHYDRARPSYPDATLSALFSELPKKAGLGIIELGAGTGIFTRALLAHPEFGPAVGKLHAVEPSSGMREVFEKSIVDSRVTSRPGTFEDTGSEDASADLVIIAQAWHWCHPNYDKGITEIARILKPSGILAFVWNMEDKDAAWVSRLRSLYEVHEDGTPQFRLMYWRQTFDTPAYKKYFAAPKEETVVRIVPTTRAGVWDRVTSKSYIAVLSDDQKASLKKDVDATLDSGDGIKWIDQETGVFEYPYKTYLVAMHRI